MGYRVITDDKQGYSCLFCSTSMTAFGPVFDEDESVYEFLEWLGDDPRKLSADELESAVAEWRQQRAKEV
jgi:hypothetical protein